MPASRDSSLLFSERGGSNMRGRRAVRYFPDVVALGPAVSGLRAARRMRSRFAATSSALVSCACLP